jgi:hypothetical protein
MTYPDTAIDKIGVELKDLAERYAQKAASLASDPYFREAVLKVSVSAFVWALYDAFSLPTDRYALEAELKEQTGAVSRSLEPTGGRHHDA